MPPGGRKKLNCRSSRHEIAGGHESVARLVVNALRQFEGSLEKGALIVLDEARARARILPLED